MNDCPHYIIIGKGISSVRIVTEKRRKVLGASEYTLVCGWCSMVSTDCLKARNKLSSLKILFCTSKAAVLVQHGSQSRCAMCVLAQLIVC